jgi:hypothetical protein
MGVRRASVWLGVVLSTVAATALLPGCTDYVIKRGHLKDNPIDQAISMGDEGVHFQEARDRLLKRFPLGTPVVTVSRYLESVGAKCRRSKAGNASVVCDYRQKEDLVLRTPVGEFLSTRSLYDFRISLAESRQGLSGIEVCRRITAVYFNEISGKPESRSEYPMRCPSDPKPY